MTGITTERTRNKTTLITLVALAALMLVASGADAAHGDFVWARAMGGTSDLSTPRKTPDSNGNGIREAPMACRQAILPQWECSSDGFSLPSTFAKINADPNWTRPRRDSVLLPAQQNMCFMAQQPIKTPSSPPLTLELLGEWPDHPRYGLGMISLYDSVAYLGAGFDLMVLDVSVPTAPHVLGRLPHSASDVDFSGPLAYMACRTGLCIYDGLLIPLA